MASSSGRSSIEEKAPRTSSSSSMRKRVSRACDECRVHKSRCDGIMPCATCLRDSRACSYTVIPDVIRDPRARIRFLQQHLSRAQQVAQDPQQRLPETIALDAFTYRDQSTLTAPSTTSFLDTSLRSVHSFADVDSCRNLASNTSLIRSLLRLVSDNNEVASILACGTIDALLAGSPIAQEPMVQVFCQLSHYSSMLGIVHSAFSQIFALSSIVPEKYFRVRAQSLYDVNPIAYEPQDMAFTPLFFAVIALGMLYSPDLHPDMSHQQVLRRSESYSRAAMTVVSDVHGYESHVHLQIALCRVLCLMNTSRLDLAKSVLQVVCRSSMLQQLIRNISMQQPDQIDFSNMLSRDIVWAVFYLDMHISSLLNIPPSLPQPGSEIATVYTINAAIYNVTNFRRSESTFLLSVSVAMAIELMKLTQSMRCNEETFRASSSQDFVTEDAAVQDLLVRVE